MRQAWLAFRKLSGDFFLLYAFSKEEAQILGDQLLFEGFNQKPLQLFRDPTSDKYALQGKDVEPNQYIKDAAWLRMYKVFKEDRNVL